MGLDSALRELGIVHDPRRIGRYELHYRLAQGGMGAVYLARLRGDGGFAKWVAVKVIHTHSQDDPKFVAMFLDEAKITAQIEHPNVARVTDFGEADRTWFLAMELLNGESVATMLKTAKGALPLPIAARIVADAARGLHAAHELRGSDGLPAHVVHRDVSPANVFVLYDGQAKVLDFGIAKARTRVAAKTNDGTVKGNFGYVAPETFKKADVDRRADVYSLGVVLWETTIGRKLYKGGPVEIMRAVLEGAPKPHTIVPGYPEALAAIVMKALQMDPEARYQTTEAMARDLERWIATSGSFAGQGEVSDFMNGLFAQRRALREQLLRESPAPLPENAPTAATLELGEAGGDEGYGVLDDSVQALGKRMTPMKGVPNMGRQATPSKGVAQPATTPSKGVGPMPMLTPSKGMTLEERDAWMRSVKIGDDAATIVQNPGGPPPRMPTPIAVPHKPELRGAPSAPHVPEVKPAAKDEAPKKSRTPTPVMDGLRASALFDFTYDQLKAQHEKEHPPLVVEASRPLVSPAPSPQPKPSDPGTAKPPSLVPSPAQATFIAPPAAKGGALKWVLLIVIVALVAGGATLAAMKLRGH